MRIILKKFFYCFLIFFSFLFALPAFAWNWVGHELVAQIAYNQLTPNEKAFWDKQISAINIVYPKQNFISVATLPDELKRRGIKAFNSWHFIDLPVFSNKKQHKNNTIKTRALDPHNVIWGIKESIRVENDSKANVFEKAFFTAFLIHLVADAHQPLHCAELYSYYFPRGDRGGNLFIIKDKKIHNLHAYWDQGGGFLSWKLAKNQKSLEATAYALEKKYPKSWFGTKANQLDPRVWVKESHHLAKKVAYIGIKEYTAPSKFYQMEVEKITQEQIVLAGYRLAMLLKQ